MTVRILNLESGSSSLEFDPVDWATIKAAIQEKWGQIAVIEHVTWSTGCFGGEEFSHENEWDDPRLISTSRAGKAMLAHLYELVGICEE